MKGGGSWSHKNNHVLGILSTCIHMVLGSQLDFKVIGMFFFVKSNISNRPDNNRVRSLQ